MVDILVIHTTSELRTLYHRYYEELKGAGTNGLPARSVECASAVNEMLGMAVAYGIVDKKFVNITKPKVILTILIYDFSLYIYCKFVFICQNM